MSDTTVGEMTEDIPRMKYLLVQHNDLSTPRPLKAYVTTVENRGINQVTVLLQGKEKKLIMGTMEHVAKMAVEDLWAILEGLHNET